jgi:DNA-binding transcriptional MerR regulator
MEQLTAAEIARRLGEPESTVRYHARRFSSFVPTTGSGRSRRYPEDAVDVLRVIGEQLRAGTPAAEIEQQLAARFPVLIEPQQPRGATQQQSATTLSEAREMVADVLRSILADTVAELRTSHEQETSALRSQVADLEREVHALREDLAARLPAPIEETTAPPSAAPTEDDRLGPHQMAHELEKRRPWWWLRDWRKRDKGKP